MEHVKPPKPFGMAEVFEESKNIAPLAKLTASNKFVGVAGYALEYLVDDQTFGLPQKDSVIHILATRAMPKSMKTIILL